jgi:hypothetical protein
MNGCEELWAIPTLPAAIIGCHADALLSFHFRLNLWNISFVDLLTYQVGCPLAHQVAAVGW